MSDQLVEEVDLPQSIIVGAPLRSRLTLERLQLERLARLPSDIDGCTRDERARATIKVPTSAGHHGKHEPFQEIHDSMREKDMN